MCYAGLDLSTTTDLTAFVLVFPDNSNGEEFYYILPYFWIPDETIDLRTRRDHVPYDFWRKEGLVNVTEGNVVDYGAIKDFIGKLGEKYNLESICYDRWNATHLAQELEDDYGFTMIPFGQGFFSMSAPTKELERLVLDKKIAHNGHKVLRWNIDNITVRQDPANNIKIDKAKSTERVDGAVALVMGLDRAIRCRGNDTSIYDSRGLIFV